MPFIVGCAWGNNNKNFADRITSKFISLLRQKGKSEIITSKSTNWVACSLLKDYEFDQEKIITLPQNSGIAVGQFYHKNGSLPEHNNNSPQSYFKHLLQNCWGRHVIFFADNNKITIFRDMIGLAQIYYYKAEGKLFFSSEIDLLFAAIGNHKCLASNINWEYMGSYLACGPLHTPMTPFKDIYELSPGCCLQYDGHELNISSKWDPSIILKPTEQFDDAIISVMNNTVQKLMDKSSSIILQLSGGLDSSSLYFSLLDVLKNDQHLNIVNYLNKLAAASDESSYVKDLVKGKSTQVIFHEHYLSISPSIIEKWNRPHPSLLNISSRQELLQIVNCGKNVLINGHGGDHIFLASTHYKFLTDYLLNNGLIGFASKLKEMSLLKRSPVLPLLWGAISELYRYTCKFNNEKYADLFAGQTDWFKPEIETLINTQIYKSPFHDKLSKIHPGKAFHILNAYHASAFGVCETTGINEVFPFLSQPLFELALTVPTFKTFNQDWSRLHFRKAVSKYYQTEHVWRQSKGEASGMIQIFMKDNIKRILSLCLEGKIAQGKLIEKDKLRKHIYRMQNGQLDELWLMLRLLSIELWFEAWSIN